MDGHRHFPRTATESRIKTILRKRNMSHAKKKSNSTNAARVQEQAPGLVCNHPISSVLVVFGIGVGAGVALGGLLSKFVTSQSGHTMQNAIAGVLPESLAKYVAAQP